MRNDEPDFRLGRGTSRGPKSDEKRAYSAAYNRIMQFTRNSARGASGGAGPRGAVRQPAQHHQRCAVRVTYAANDKPGQWGAHGTYIEREAATQYAKDIENPDQSNQEHHNDEPERQPGYASASRTGGAAPLRESDFEADSRREAPKKLHGLRRLSDVLVVRFARGLKVLLSSDAPGHLGEGHSERDDPLRRRGASAVGANSTDAQQRVAPAHATAVFGSAGRNLDARATLASWQKAGDERMFKIIVSAEFGHNLDHEKHTHALVAQMQRDLRTQLEWVAVTHTNTDHPHTHLSVRGRDEAGNALRIPPEYIKKQLREHAASLVTAQLGWRTEHDAIIAATREITAQRFTGLDASLMRASTPSPATAFAPVDLAKLPKQTKTQSMQRLTQLAIMGLAQRTAPDLWAVRTDLAHVLRTMQNVADRQRSLHAHRALLSDDRLQLTVADTRKLRLLLGRIIGHGLDEGTGKPYTILEALPGNVVYMLQDSAIVSARQQGLLQPGAFVSIKKTFERQGERMQPRITINDMGDAEKMLTNQAYLKRAAANSARTASAETVTQFGGWLGRHAAAVQAYARAHPHTHQTKSSPGRGERG